jgi:hypothetical protein
LEGLDEVSLFGLCLVLFGLDVSGFI